MFSDVIQTGDHMFSNKIQPTSELYAAARSGSLDDVKNILEKYKSQGLKPDRGTLSAAIKSRNVSLVQYFKDEHNPSLLADEGTLFDAVRSGSLQMVKYIVEECGVTDIDEAHKFADRGGKEEIAKYLQDRLNDRPKMSH